ncbi:MAG: lipid A deacylase LpxR family protein [Phycisphaeraceae bacterium]
MKRFVLAAVFVAGWVGLCVAVAPAEDVAAPSPSQPQPRQSPQPHPFRFTLFWENDSTPLNRIEPSDRHYTNGTAIHITWPLDEPDTAIGFTLGQLMFSPENLGPKSIITNDAPYAGYLYLGGYWQRADEHRTTLDHIQLDIGTIGESSLAEPIQKSIHEWVNADRPNGWRHQLGDEPTFQLTYRKKWRLNLLGHDPTRTDQLIYDMAYSEQTFFDRLTGNLRVELIPAVSLSLGTVQRYADAGGVLRLGWNMPNDFGPARLADLASGEALAGPQQQGLSFYVFGRATGRAVQYDHFLDGSDFQHEEHTVDSRPLVAEFQFGTAVAYHYDPFSVELNYAVTFLTDTFYHQQYADKYGAVSLKITYWF